jgi:F-type H+-transporting ATPase subunit delta
MEVAVLRNYAEALYERAAERGQLEAVRAALEPISTALTAEPELRRLAAHPGIDEQRKLALLSGALGEPAVPLVEDFLRLLLERGRLGDLPEITAALSRLTEEHAGRQPITVETGAPLSDEQVARLAEALERLVGQPVQVSWQLTPEVIGGLRIHINSEILDETVSGRLDRIGEHLIAG